MPIFMKKKAKTRRRILRRIIVAILVLALLAGGAWIAYRALKQEYSVTYQGYTATTGSISNALSFSGNLSLVSSESYSASSSSTVRTVYVSAGDEVSEGDKLVRLANGQTVEAGLDGRVNAVSVAEGDSVAAGAALVQVADFTHLKVQLRVDEYDVGSVHVGDACTVTATATEKTFESKIAAIDYISASGGSVAYYTATAYVDVDDFKLYNQLYGVEAGDAALRSICQTITLCVGEAGTVFRTSGKVFAVLLPGRDVQQSMALMREILRRVGQINRPDAYPSRKPLTVSVGICTAPYAASSAKELMDNADLAAYNAKQHGKNQLMVFRGAMERMPQHLAERTDAIINRIEKDGGGHYQGAMSMIAALTAAIDAKDHYTYAHSKNVARYASSLAVAAGLNEEQVRTIYVAGLLHDIGKISIPETILNKTGKLTDEEYSIMKDHVNNSIEMIRHLPEMDYVIPAALGHHERWDGKGYPRGLSGEQIPITARCLSIADVFDAMTTDRPYRKGLPLDYAADEIERGAGTQFDPALAPVFAKLIRDREIPLAAACCQNGG